MIKIAIDDDIGWWGISSKYISDKLANIKEGEEVEIIINSPGGSVYEGIAIFNTIRKIAETHPVRVWINGIAASMASYIAIAARAYDKNLKITVNENSIFFIHNPWNYTWGDYKAFKKEADYLERLAKVCGLAYSAVSELDIKKIRDAMDEETYYIGQEIVDAGFANDFEALYAGSEDAADRDVLITQAQLKMEAVMKASREKCKPGELEKAVAMLGDNFEKNILGEGRGSGSQPNAAKETSAPQPPAINKNSGDEPSAKNQGGGIMTLQELMAKHPDLYNEVLALGATQALEKERKRVNAHLKIGKESGALELAAQFIQEDKSIQDDDVFAEYRTAAMKNQHIENRNADNPKGTTTQDEKDADGAEVMKAFDLGYSGKNLKGEE